MTPALLGKGGCHCEIHSFKEGSDFKQLQLGRAMPGGTAPPILQPWHLLAPVTSGVHCWGPVLQCLMKGKGTPWSTVRHLAQFPKQRRSCSDVYLFVSHLGFVLVFLCGVFLCGVGGTGEWEGKLEI